MDQPIKRGTQVEIITTNGGQTEAILDQWYGPSFTGWFHYETGYRFSIEGSRIESVKPIVQCWYCQNGQASQCRGFVMVPDREHDTRTSLKQRAPYRRIPCGTAA